MGTCCSSKKKAKESEKLRKSEKSSSRSKKSSRMSKDHSASSLKSRSPSYEDLHYKRTRQRRSTNKDVYSETYIKCRNASPTVHVHFYQGSGALEKAADFYLTYKAPLAQDSNYFGRLPPMPVSPMPASPMPASKPLPTPSLVAFGSTLKQKPAEPKTADKIDPGSSVNDENKELREDSGTKSM